MIDIDLTWFMQLYLFSCKTMKNLIYVKLCCWYIHPPWVTFKQINKKWINISLWCFVWVCACVYVCKKRKKRVQNALKILVRTNDQRDFFFFDWSEKMRRFVTFESFIFTLNVVADTMKNSCLFEHLSKQNQGKNYHSN